MLAATPPEPIDAVVIAYCFTLVEHPHPRCLIISDTGLRSVTRVASPYRADAVPLIRPATTSIECNGRCPLPYVLGSSCAFVPSSTGALLPALNLVEDPPPVLSRQPSTLRVKDVTRPSYRASPLSGIANPGDPFIYPPRVPPRCCATRLVIQETRAPRASCRTAYGRLIVCASAS